MSRNRESKMGETPAHIVAANWFNAQALEPVHELNERFIELLIRLAAAGQRHEPMPFQLLRQLGASLLEMSAASRRRAAHCLFLLVEVQFGHAEWWPAAQAPPRPSVSTMLWPPSVPRKLVTELTRAVLHLAWHTARENRHAACLLLGLTPPVAEILAKLSLREVGAIAERQFRQLKPRWEDRPFVWQQLIASARIEDAHAWRAFHVQGLQLLAGDCATHGR